MTVLPRSQASPRPAAPDPAAPDPVPPAPTAERLEPIEAHARALGFATLLQYRLWCHRHGFGGGLDKDAGQRQAEVEAVRRLRPPCRDGSGLRADLLRRLVDGDLPDAYAARRRPCSGISRGISWCATTRRGP